MKLRTLSVLAGVSAPLILTSSASAGFVGLRVFTKQSEINPNRLICNIYAEFDRPGEDHMNIVLGTPLNPMRIDVISGKFFNPNAGGDTAPPPDGPVDDSFECN